MYTYTYVYKRVNTVCRYLMQLGVWELGRYIYFVIFVFYYYYENNTKMNRKMIKQY